MGIKGLAEFLRKQVPDAFFDLPLSALRGKRIAIDAHGYLYTILAVARKRVIKRTDVLLERPNEAAIRAEWFEAALNFILGWLANEVTPIFCFDGEPRPEKLETRAKRQSGREKHATRVAELYEKLGEGLLQFPAQSEAEL